MADHFLQGSPTNFRREHITLGTDVDGYVLVFVCHLHRKASVLTVSATRNAMLVEQAREDALEMHRASKMDGLRKHARNVSAKFGASGKTGFEEDLH